MHATRKFPIFNFQFSISAGLTLIELLVVVTILGIALAVLAAAVDPIAQLNKSDDVRRLQNLTQMRSALDSYYNDKNVYPTGLPFGSAFTGPTPGCAVGSNGCTTYMKSLPVANNYKYIVGPTPQWAVIFTKLASSDSSCQAVQTAPNCQPLGYSSSWACVTFGTVDCNYLKTQTLP